MEISRQVLPGAKIRFFHFLGENIIFHPFLLFSLNSLQKNIMFKKKEHQNWVKIDEMRGNQSFQVQENFLLHCLGHDISSLRHMTIILASKYHKISQGIH